MMSSYKNSWFSVIGNSKKNTEYIYLIKVM